MPAAVPTSPPVNPEPSDAELVAAVLAGDTARFEELVRRYQPRLFATARRYARREDEVQDSVQEIFLKAFSKLGSWRGDAPFEHWLMRTAVHACYDALRAHQRNREHNATDLSADETDWLERFAVAPEATGTDVDAARCHPLSGPVSSCSAAPSSARRSPPSSARASMLTSARPKGISASSGNR